MSHKIAKEKATGHTSAPIKRSRVDRDYIVKNCNWNKDQSQHQDRSCQNIEGGVFFVKRRKDGMSLRPAGVLWLIPLLMVFNGFTPYLGLKTRSSFDMYSNLRIRGTESNHFLIPHPLDLLGYSGDLVRVMESDEIALQQDFITPGLYSTYFEFRSYFSSRPNAAVKYEHNGEVFNLARADERPELMSRPGMLERKLVWYRPVDPSPKNRCQW